VSRPRLDLFIVSALVLFLELACIRWFPAHVLFLTFFTNTVLLACFLGMSVGCLAAARKSNYLLWTPMLLALALGAARWVEYERQRGGGLVDVGHQVSPQLVFFGTEYGLSDPSKFLIPIEAVLGFFFVIIALALLGPGQHLGRSLARVQNRVEAYTVNIVGSIAGIAIFTACSWWQLGPLWWFALVLAAVFYSIAPKGRTRALVLTLSSAAVLWLAASEVDFARRVGDGIRTFWSPYYRIDYQEAPRLISVNLIGHQQMISRQAFSPAYALPHLLNRDSGKPPFGQVLIIGAGSGNDVSRALEWGAERVDAVEIDPVIHRLGLRDHPDRPYSDERVFVHLDDGRNFLRSTDKQYDLIVYALVDSLVLHSSYSNIRLESYLFTQQAFRDIQKRLRPGGMFVMYNYFRQGWIVSRLTAMLEEVFGTGNAVVFNLPARETVRPDDVLFGEFTLLFAGATAPIKEAFAQHPEFWLRADRASDRATPNGFELSDDRSAARLRMRDAKWVQFRPTTVVRPPDAMNLATDAWPFLYLRRPMIPALSLRGMAVMATLALLFALPFVRRRSHAVAAAVRRKSGGGLLAQMFFLGAGFMLIETKAVVQMALLFGSTWIVNAIVFFAVLSMILVANLFVLLVRPRSLALFYGGLVITLAANAVVPLDAFLGLPREAQVLGSCLLAFTPILFAGVIFAVSFSRTVDADRAFGANIAGAMAGGLSEYSSMLVGFQYIVLVALVFYMLSAWAERRSLAPERAAVHT
jgi:SAM-dependent methyltransferase